MLQLTSLANNALVCKFYGRVWTASLQAKSTFAAELSAQDSAKGTSDAIFMTTRGGEIYDRTFLSSFIRPGIAVVRLYDGGPRTALCWVDPTEGTITEALKLPSGGDTSYAGAVWHDGLLWISYYSSHEGKTSIYLAKVKFE